MNALCVWFYEVLNLSAVETKRYTFMLVNNSHLGSQR